jgi:myo-inositol 2-dehydrogenase / D-chiro-inositol 1-dehydrogenase
MKQSRRTFLGATGLGVTGMMIVKSQAVRGSDANSAIRIGLLGCGGRGSADATSMVENAGGRIVALADLFQDQLDKAAKRFNTLGAKHGHSAIDAAQIFLGPHAFEQITASKEVDAIIIATPPYFHPRHLAAVVDAGKHVYCEKPVAVDVAGTQHVLEIGKKAEGRLSLDVGLQIRHAPPFVELVRRIHAGALGEIAFGEAHYFCPFLGKGLTGTPTHEERLRNWLYDRVLSGDILVEQNIHAIDVCNWVLKSHPIKAAGLGGRKGRSEVGSALGHTAVTFWYPDDVHVSFSSKQFGKGGGFDVTENFFGTRGNSQSPYSGTLGITGEDAWTWKGSENQQGAEFSTSGVFTDNLAQADAEKHKAFLQSIQSGKFHNQAALGVEASLSAMLGREAIYAGHEITWDQLLRSKKPWDAKLDLNKLT